MNPITIAAVSCLILPGNPAANLDRIEVWTRRAAEAGAELVLFNETSISGYWQSLELRKVAEPLDGPSVTRLTVLARELDILIAAGLMERAEDGFFNTHVLVGPQGLIGIHRKSSVPAGEERWFDVGNDANVFDIGPCKVGIAICFESVHPETCRKLRENGAQVILAPYMNAVTAQEIHEGKRPYFSARAQENGVWYVACDQAHRNPEAPTGITPGAVCFVNPAGEIVAVTALEETNEHMLLYRLEPADSD